MLEQAGWQARATEGTGVPVGQEVFVDQRTEIRRLSRAVGKMTVPVLVEQFFIVIMGVVNTMLASNMGKEAISAIGMIDTISIIIISLFSALALGGTVVVAQYVGHKELARASQAAAQALVSSLVLSGLTTLLIFAVKHLIVHGLYGNAEPAVLAYAMDYLSITLWSYVPIAMVSIAFGILRGSGDTRTPMVVSILMNLLNVLFSSILIYGLDVRLGGQILVIPAYGVRGAATGLTLARLGGMLIVLVPLLRGSKRIKLNQLWLFRPDWLLLRSIFSLGIPASAEQLMFNGGKLITQTYIVRLGTTALAANSITNSIISLIMIPGNALAIAATAMIGQLVGACQYHEARKQLRFLILASSAAMTVLGIVILPFHHGFISLYTQDPEVIRTVSILFISSMIAQPLLWSSSFITPAGLRGAGDIRYTMAVSIVSMWILRIGFGYVFAVILPWGVLGVWIAMYVDWIGRSIYFIRRMSRQEWLNRAIVCSR
jgi:putative MATE family efflux protein